MFRITALDLPPIASANGVVSLPGSKSISNRVLLLSALSDGITTIHDLLDSDDTRVMLRALEQLGCNVEQEVDGVCRIEGIGGRAHCMDASLFLGNAGTAMRPLTAALALLSGQFELHGVERMHQRPIGDLVDALRQLGCLIEYAGDDGFPPLKIRGADRTELKLDKPVAVRGDVSSQFLTALLLALPLAAKERPVVIEVLGTLISRPYIEITLNLLQRFGIKIERDEWRRFIIPAGSQYRTPGDIHIEADASSASYFIAAGALGANAAKGHSIRIEGVGDQSIQGDIRFVDAARRMGASIETEANTLTVSRGAWPLRAIDMDCNQIPDAAMTLAVMALFADGPSLLRNIASWRVKETDRIDAMAAELGRLGARVESGADYIRIWPLASADWKAAAIRTYDDHRMAMCFSLAAFNPARRPVRIFDPSCVSKTFPDYFEALLDVTLPVQDEVPVICVDGPTASGKGTLASALAERLGYHYLDSGAIYRAVGVAMRQRGLRPEPVDESAIAEMARALPLRFKFDSVFIGSVDVTAEIRSESAGMDASRVSTLSLVRNALFALQTGFLRAPGLVADGRDMGTVVFPQARLKVFLTASAEHRADRRYRQLISKGKTANIVDLRVGLEARDLRDMSRQIAPLAPASDACFLDNSGLSIEQSVDRVLEWWRQRQPFEATA